MRICLFERHFQAVFGFFPEIRLKKRTECATLSYSFYYDRGGTLMFILPAGHNPFTRPAGIIRLYHFPDGLPDLRNMFALDGEETHSGNLNHKEPARRRKS
ncbi:MAG: hypothetical protein IKP09_05320 [Lentisphaeria bacterium]|nr:hypothetical protein [Lentisphaeria bacterium]